MAEYNGKQIVISKSNGTKDVINISNETLDGKYFPNRKYFHYDLNQGWTFKNHSFDVYIGEQFESKDNVIKVTPDMSYFSAAYLWNGSDSISSKNNYDNEKNMSIYSNNTNSTLINISTSNVMQLSGIYQNMHSDDYENYNTRIITGYYGAVKNGNQITNNDYTSSTDVKISTSSQYVIDKSSTYIISFKMSRTGGIGANLPILSLCNERIALRYVNGSGIQLLVKNNSGNSYLSMNYVYAPFDSTERIYTLYITKNNTDKTLIAFYYSEINGYYNLIDKCIFDGDNRNSNASDYNIIIPKIYKAVNFESVYEAIFNGMFNKENGGLPFLTQSYFNFVGELMTPSMISNKEPLQHFYNKGVLNSITGNKIKLWDDAAKNTLSGNVLNNLLNVDGHNSGLDADKLDGVHANELFNTFTAVKNNFNEIKTDGKYLVYKTTDIPLNSPNNNHSMWIGVVYHYGSYIFQIAIQAGSSNTRAYIRSATNYGNNDNNWTAWNSLWTSENQFYSTDKQTNNFNLATEEGRYSITNNGNPVLNSPRAGTDDDFPYWMCLVYRLEGVACQIAIAIADSPRTYIRYIAPTSSSTNLPEHFDTSWHALWNGSNDGHNSTLDADTLDGYHASHFASKEDVQLITDNIDTSEFMHVYDDDLVTELPTETGVYTYYTDTITGATDLYTLITMKDKSTNLITYLAVSFNTQTVYVNNDVTNKWSSLTTSTEVTTQISNALGGFDADDFVKDYETVYNSFNLLPLQPGMFRVTSSSTNDAPSVAQSTQYWSCIQTRSGVDNNLFMQLALHRDSGSTNWHPDIYIRGVNGNAGLVPTSSIVATKNSSGNYIAYASVGTWKQIGGSSTSAETATNADTVDGYHATQLAKTHSTFVTTLPTETGVYLYTGDDIEGSGNSYLLTVAHSDYSLLYTAVNTVTRKLYVANSYNNSAVTWNELTTTLTIPVVTSDPSDAVDGSIWIRSDLL